MMRLGRPMRWIVLVGGVAITAHAAFAGLNYWKNLPIGGAGDFQAGFDAAGLAEWERAGYVELCCAHSLTAVVDAGRPDAGLFRLDWSDPEAAGNKRAEVRLRAARFHEDHSYAFSVMLPENWRPDPQPVTVAQWHGVRDQILGEGGRAPPLRLLVVGDEWIVVGGDDPRRVSRFWFEPHENERHRILWRAPIEPGVWTDWRFDVRWSPGADGRLRVVRDGVTLVDQAGPNAFADPLGPFFKVGLYVPSWKGLGAAPEPPSHRVLVAAVRVLRSAVFSPER